MKRLLLLLVLVCFVFILSAGKPTGPEVYLNFEEYGGTWADAEKTGYNDSLMCWAAVASNILHWTDWGGDFENEDEIFAHFVDHWTDDPGLQGVGYKYWFDGTNYYEGEPGFSQIDVEGGGEFYPELDFYQYHVYRSFWGTGDTRDAFPMVVDLLHNGYGVGICITHSENPKSPNGWPYSSHCLTVWGYEKEGNQYTALYVTDSDDNGYQLVRMPLRLSKGKYWVTYNDDWIYLVDGLLIRTGT